MIQAGIAGLGVLGLVRGIAGELTSKSVEGVNPQDFANKLKNSLSSFDLPSKAQAIFSKLKAQPEIVEYLSQAQKEDVMKEFKGLLSEFTDHAGRVGAGVIEDVKIEAGAIRFTIDGKSYDLSHLSKIVDQVKGKGGGHD